MWLVRPAKVALLTLAGVVALATASTAADAVWTAALAGCAALWSRKRRCAFDGVARHASYAEKLWAQIDRPIANPRLYLSAYVFMAVGTQCILGRAAAVVTVVQTRLRLQPRPIHGQWLTSCVVPALWWRLKTALSAWLPAWVALLVVSGIFAFRLAVELKVAPASFYGRDGTWRYCAVFFGLACAFCKDAPAAHLLLQACAPAACCWGAWWLWAAPRLAAHSPRYAAAIDAATGANDYAAVAAADAGCWGASGTTAAGGLDVPGTTAAASREAPGATGCREVIGARADGKWAGRLRHAVADLAYGGLCTAGMASAPCLATSTSTMSILAPSRPPPPRFASAGAWATSPPADNAALAASVIGEVLGRRPNSGKAAHALAVVACEYMAAPRPLRLYIHRLGPLDRAGWHLGPRVYGGEAGPAHVRYRELLDGTGAPVLVQLPLRRIAESPDGLADFSLGYGHPCPHECAHCAPSHAGRFPHNPQIAPTWLRGGEVEEKQEVVAEEADVDVQKTACAAARLVDDNLRWLAGELPGIYSTAEADTTCSFAEPQFFCRECRYDHAAREMEPHHINYSTALLLTCRVRYVLSRTEAPAKSNHYIGFMFAPLQPPLLPPPPTAAVPATVASTEPPLPERCAALGEVVFAGPTPYPDFVRFRVPAPCHCWVGL